MSEQQIPTFLKVLTYTNYVCGAGIIILGLVIITILPKIINSYLNSLNSIINLTTLISIISLIIGLSIIGGGIFQVILGWGYSHKKRWARSTTLSVSFVSLLFGLFALGGLPKSFSSIEGIMFISNLITVTIAVFIIYYFLTPEIKKWFEPEKQEPTNL
jgi:hypothetical protein